jgi:hypothetical protein
MSNLYESKPESESDSESDSKRKYEASVKLAYFRSIIGKPECINICEKYINDGINNENNDMLSLLMAELLFDDSTYFRFIYISFQKDGIITDPDEIVILDNILSSLNQSIQTLYKPIIQTLLNKPFDSNMSIFYSQLKKRILQGYIEMFNNNQ